MKVKTYHTALVELFKQAAMSHDMTLTGIASKLLELSTEPAKALDYWRKAKEYASKAVDTLTVQEIEDYLQGGSEMTIKNGDLPAMPIELNGFGLFAPEAHTGLTKREQFAAMAMQGVLVNMGRNGIDSVKQAAEHGVAAADALLVELERTKGEVK